MANIGLTNIWFSKLTENDGVASYEGATNLGKAVSCSVSITNNEAKLYGDDVLAESDTSFANGTITIGVTDDDDTVFAPLLGHTIDASGEVLYKADDVAPYVGIGRIVTKMVNGAYKYRVLFLYKVKFGTPSSDENTKNESIEFATPSIEGIIATLDDTHGTWQKSKTFNTKSDALTYLKNLMAAPGTKYRVTFDLMGGTSATVEDTDVNASSSINLDDGTNITAPAGKEFVGWATTAGATTADVTSPYTPSDDITLYAVYQNET